MNKITYNERVQALAEKMAIDHFEKHIAASDYPVDGWIGLTITEKEVWIISEIDRARMAVAEMAEAYKAGWCEIYDFSNDPEFGPDIQKGLIKLGLIPDNGQESAFEKAIRETAERNNGQEAGSDAP